MKKRLKKAINRIGMFYYMMAHEWWDDLTTDGINDFWSTHRLMCLLVAAPISTIWSLIYLVQLQFWKFLATSTIGLGLVWVSVFLSTSIILYIGALATIMYEHISKKYNNLTRKYGKDL